MFFDLLHIWLIILEFFAQAKCIINQKTLFITDKQCFSIEKHSFSLEKHSFFGSINRAYHRKTLFFNKTMFFTSGADKLCLSQKNYVFHWKNRIYRSINSIYQIEKQGLSINCFFFDRKNTVYWSINSVYQIEKQSFLINSVFQSKNIAFLRIMFLVDKLWLSTWKTMFFDLKN